MRSEIFLRYGWKRLDATEAARGRTMPLRTVLLGARKRERKVWESLKSHIANLEFRLVEIFEVPDVDRRQVLNRHCPKRKGTYIY
jgi:hypothetical protein